MFWTYNSSQARLYFATEVETRGWIGLGFTYNINTNMDGYDVAIGYIVPGTSRTELKVTTVSTYSSQYSVLKTAFKIIKLFIVSIVRVRRVRFRLIFHCLKTLKAVKEQ